MEQTRDASPGAVSGTPSAKVPGPDAVGEPRIKGISPKLLSPCAQFVGE